MVGRLLFFCDPAKMWGIPKACRLEPLTYRLQMYCVVNIMFQVARMVLLRFGDRCQDKNRSKFQYLDWQFFYKSLNIHEPDARNFQQGRFRRISIPQAISNQCNVLIGVTMRRSFNPLHREKWWSLFSLLLSAHKTENDLQTTTPRRHYVIESSNYNRIYISYRIMV